MSGRVRKMSGGGSEGTGGLTLLEVLISMVILSVAALGMMRYHCDSTRQTRLAEVEIIATRTGQLLLEDWKANGGSVDYDPQRLNMDITQISGEGGFDTEGNLLMVYQTVADGVPLRIELLRPQGFAGTIPLIHLTVSVQWRRDFGDGDIRVADPSVVLATYARGYEAVG